MKNPYRIATFLIATCAITTSALGQAVYRCGSTYSQVPCPGAVAVDTRDVRTKRQKTETDKANERNAAAAREIENKRLKEEAKAQKESAAIAAEFSANSKPSKAALAAERADTQPYTKDDAPKKKKSKKKEPTYFTATVPPEKKSAATPAATPPSKPTSQ